MGAATADFSVVICAYTERRWEQLSAAVHSARQQTLPPREVVVVVDHNPRLLERARGELQDVVVLANREAPGLAGARNTGVAACAGSIVAFLDDDAVAAPSWLARLADVYADELVVGAGGAVLPLWATPRPAWFPPEFDWVVGCTYRGLPEARQPVRNLIGANMSFRREVFAHVQFYPGLGHAGGRSIGGEETDFCIRVKALSPDRLIVFEPKAVVEHQVPEERARWSYFVRRCFNEGRSKAVLSRRVGAGRGLQAERTYATRVLPAALPKALRAAARERQPALALRVPAVGCGLALTAMGYAVNVATRRSSMR